MARFSGPSPGRGQRVDGLAEVQVTSPMLAAALHAAPARFSSSATGRSNPRSAKPKPNVHFALTRPRDRQRAAVEIPDNPSLLQGDSQEGGAQCSSQMRSPFTPVHAREREPAT